jgi:hypothetical protein
VSDYGMPEDPEEGQRRAAEQADALAETGQGQGGVRMAADTCGACWKNPVQTTYKGVPVCKPCRIWLRWLAGRKGGKS